MDLVRRFAREQRLTSYDLKRHTGLLRFLTVREGKATVPVELVWMTVEAAGGEEKAPVGRDGEFYLENLATGAHSATVTWKSKPCAATIEVPETEEVMVDLGDVVCVPR